MFVKWKLLITTLPFVAAAIGLKIALEHGVGFAGVVDFGDMGLVLTGGIFLIGFMLAGTMSDYKESEKLPAEIACALETIEETLSLAASSKPALDKAALRRSVATATDGIYDWFLHKRPQEDIFTILGDVETFAVKLDQAGVASLAVRVLAELHNLRKALSRALVISRTNFLATGYALMETLVTLVIALLMISKFKTAIAEYMLVGFVTLVYVYMIRLIKDIDDPFEYSPDGQAGAAEVDLFPIVEYRARVTARVAAEPAQAAIQRAS